MANPTWGMLAKSLVDDETIEEAIDRLILAHNEDEESHLGAGQSLSSHKASEVIDHVVASIIADKIKDFEITTLKLSCDKYVINPSFESLDAWTVAGTGGATLRLGYVLVYTAATTDSAESVLSLTTEIPLNLAEKNPIFEALVVIGYDEKQLVKFGAGGLGTNFIGFKVLDDKIYSYIRIGANEYSTELADVVPFALSIYRIVCHSGVDVEFWINGVLKHTETEHLPTATSVSDAMGINIKTTENVGKAMVVTEMRYAQDR